MKRIAVILAGCGHQDGTEITEAISVLVSLARLQAQVECFAPKFETSTRNHLSGELSPPRDLLIESARITRGKSLDLALLNPDNFDALVLPGGMGMVLHLSTWASHGARCQVLPKLEAVLKAFHQQGKPIGGICIAPAVLARVLGAHEVVVTIGQDTETALEIEKTGALHETCAVDDFITDRANKVVTTPAYMYDKATPNQVFLGIERMISELVEMA